MVADMSELVAQMKAQEPRKTGWLIHKAGRGWYMPNALGYTSDPSIAGRFSYDDALSYSHPNGWTGPRDGITIKHENGISPNAAAGPLPLTTKGMAREIDALATEVERLRGALQGCAAWMDRLRISGDAGNWEWADDSEYSRACAVLLGGANG